VTRPKGSESRSSRGYGAPEPVEDELYVIPPPRPPAPNWRIRPAIREDIPRLVRLRELCYMQPLPDVFRWPAEVFESQLKIFPQGQLVVETEGRVVAGATSCLLELHGGIPGWKKLNLNLLPSIAGHRPEGDTLFLVDLVVHPLYRRQHFALELCEAMRKMVRTKKWKNLIVVTRLPGYRAHSGKLSIDEYVRRVLDGKLSDAVLTMWLRAELSPQAILPEFYPDSESCGFAVLMEWSPAGSPRPFSRSRNNDSTMSGTFVDP